MRLEKPSSRGLFFIMLLAGIALPSLVFPGLMFATQVSQLVWALAFLDLVILGHFLAGRPLVISAGWPEGLLGAIVVVLVAFNLGQPLVCAVILTFGLLFVLVSRCLTSEQVAFVLAGSALVAALIGLSQCWSYKIGLIPTLSAFYPGRLVGPFGQPNLFGCFLLLGLFGYLHVLYAQNRTRLLEFAPFVVIATAIILTGSRAVALALILSLMVVFLRVYRRRLLRPRIKFLVMTSIALLLSYVLATDVFRAEMQMVSTPAAETGLSRSISQVATMQGDQSAYMRFNYWFTAILMATDHPWTGVGIGRYKEHLGDYMLPAAETLRLTYDSFTHTMWPHNDFLQVLAETGLPVFLLVVALFLGAGVQAFRFLPDKKIFLLAGFLSFVLCMMLGHPLRYPATTFVFVLLASLVFPWSKPCLRISGKRFFLCLLPILLGIHLLLGWHVYNMYRLNRGMQAMAEAKEKTVEGYSRVEREWLAGSMEDDIHGWLFRDSLLTELSRKALFRDDRELATYLLPRALEFRERNRFHYFDFSISLLYFVVGDYEASRDFAREADEKKPDKSIYFDLFHLNNAYIISRDEGIPLEKLINPKHIVNLKNNGVVRDRHMDDRGVIVRSLAQ